MAIGGIIIVVARFAVTQLAKSSSDATIKKIKRNPDLAQEVANELDIQISSRENFNAEHFKKLNQYLHEVSIVGIYQILFVADVNSDQFIVFTKISFTDFAVNVSGNAKDVKKTEYLNFVVLHHNQTLVVRSQIYDSANDKLLKEGFLKAVFEGGQSS